MYLKTLNNPFQKETVQNPLSEFFKKKKKRNYKRISSNINRSYNPESKN